MMISYQARQGIEHLFMTSVKTHFVVSGGDHCEVIQARDKGIAKSEEKNIIILTLSSFSFRLHTIFYMNEEPSVIAYFQREGSTETFEEILSEYGNLCCGSINRELAKFIPHLGMSTPYRLDRECMSFFESLQPEFLSNYWITINDSIQLRAVLCMHAYGAIDFSIDTKSLPEEETGELELF